jgi:histidine triad (HIT) family protein
MPATCVFCAIISGEQKAVIIAETERLIAFLDHRPLFRGHTLLVPKLHVRLLSDLPADWAQEFLTTAQRLERAVEDGLGADGSMILVNNVVSQSVPHLHLHVIPRSKGDGLRFWLGPRHPYDAAHPAEAFAEKIRAALPETVAPQELRGEVPRAGAVAAEDVVGVRQLAVGYRQASAADAPGQAVAQVLQLADPLVEVAAPARGKPGPVLAGGCPPGGKRVEGGPDPGQRNADTLRGTDERHPAQHRPRVTPLVACRPARGDQALGLVEVQRGNRHAAAGRELADGHLPCRARNLCHH